MAVWPVLAFMAITRPRIEKMDKIRPLLYIIGGIFSMKSGLIFTIF